MLLTVIFPAGEEQQTIFLTSPLMVAILKGHKYHA
jgi:hypothetical protein